MATTIIRDRHGDAKRYDLSKLYQVRQYSRDGAFAYSPYTTRENGGISIQGVWITHKGAVIVETYSIWEDRNTHGVVGTQYHFADQSEIANLTEKTHDPSLMALIPVAECPLSEGDNQMNTKTQGHTPAQPWHTELDHCKCIENPRPRIYDNEVHCTACDGLYRGYVHLCHVHEAAPALLAALQEWIAAEREPKRDPVRTAIALKRAERIVAQATGQEG